MSPVLNTCQAGQGDGGAVVGVKAFGFDHGLAVKTESALAAVFGGLGSSRDALLSPGRERER